MKKPPSLEKGKNDKRQRKGEEGKETCIVYMYHIIQRIQTCHENRTFFCFAFSFLSFFIAF